MGVNTAIPTSTSAKGSFANSYSESNSPILVNAGLKTFRNYEIYDTSGKIVQKGKSKTREIILNFYIKGSNILLFIGKDGQIDHLISEQSDHLLSGLYLK